MPTLALTFPSIDPVLIEFGPFAIRWYALAYIGGLVFAWQYLRWLVRRPGWRLTPEDLDDLLFYATLGVVLGGRIGFVLFYRPGYYLEHPLEALAIWQGGMSFHGGMLGVTAALIWFARSRGRPILAIADAAAAATPVGLFLGRIANFINGELYGRVSDVPWAMVFPGAGPEPRHPSQLYEAALEGIVLMAVVTWLALRPRRIEHEGRITGAFLVGYGLARSFAELFRGLDPEIGLIFGFLSMGQLLSLPMIAFGLFLIGRTHAGIRHRFAPRT